MAQGLKNLCANAGDTGDVGSSPGESSRTRVGTWVSCVSSIAGRFFGNEPLGMVSGACFYLGAQQMLLEQIFSLVSRGTVDRTTAISLFPAWEADLKELSLAGGLLREN